MAIFKGAGVAIVTPMKENLEINYDKLDEIIEEQIAGGTDAIIICGTTGESATMTEAEHSEAIRFDDRESKSQNPSYCRNWFKLYKDSDRALQGSRERRR